MLLSFFMLPFPPSLKFKKDHAPVAVLRTSNPVNLLYPKIRRIPETHKTSGNMTLPQPTESDGPETVS